MRKDYFINKLDIKYLEKNIKDFEKPKVLVMNDNTYSLLCKSGYYVETKVNEYTRQINDKGYPCIAEYRTFQGVPIALSWYLNDGEVDIL